MSGQDQSTSDTLNAVSTSAAGTTSSSSSEVANSSAADTTTVSTIPPSISSHPLEHTWTLWFTPGGSSDGSGGWKSNLKAVCSFSTVEDFWRLFNAIKTPSALSVRTHEYNLFKSGISGEWEDPANVNGGQWKLTYPNSAASRLDDAWLETCMAMIGEQFTYGDDINGIVVQKRKEFRLALWTRTTSAESNMEIGRQWKQFTSYDGGKIEFTSNEDAVAKGTARRTPVRYQV